MIESNVAVHLTVTPKGVLHIKTMVKIQITFDTAPCRLTYWQTLRRILVHLTSGSVLVINQLDAQNLVL